MKKNKIVKDGLYSLISNYFGQACNIFRTFYSANILGPNVFGIWSIVLFYIGFGRYSSFGFGEYVTRVVSYNIGSNNESENRVIVKLYFLFSLLATSLFFIVGLIFLHFFSKQDSPFKFFTVIFFQLTMIFQVWEKFFTSILQAKSKFKELAYMRISLAVITLALVILLIKSKAYYAMLISYSAGVFVSALVGFIFLLAYLLKDLEGVLSFSYFGRSLIYGIFSTSFMLFVTTLYVNSIAFLEKFFVTINYSTLENGLYLFSSNIVNSINLIIFSFTLVIYQRMNEVYGETNNKFEVYSLVKRSIEKITLWFPALIILCYFIIPEFIKLYFKKYLEAIIIFKSLIFSGYFYSIFLLYFYQLLSIKKQKIVVVCYSLMILFFSISYFFITKSYSIFTLPYVVIIVQFIFLLSNIFILKKSSDFNFSILIIVVKILIPFAVAFAGSTFFDTLKISKYYYSDILLKVVFLEFIYFCFYYFFMRRIRQK